MPHPHAPTIDAWVSHLSKAVGVADRHTFLIGHSIGCQTILRYLERLPSGTAVGGVVLVAPFLTLTGLEGDEEPIARPWLTTPVSDRAVREHTPRLAAIFSDNDAFVPIENRALFEERFGAATYVEHERNHFSGIDGIRELPKALELVLGFAA
jgi:predicted alpha/beta hydrolase family esterase